MKIMAISDEESKYLWDYYQKEKLDGVELILSSGDLDPDYLSFLATVSSVPVLYVKALKSIQEAGIVIKGCSHITGGGFYENIPRMLPEGIRAAVEKDSYEVPAIFRLLAKKGDIEEQMMYSTYNMGLGMVLAVAPDDRDKCLEAIRAAGETPYVVGRCAAGEKGVDIC